MTTQSLSVSERTSDEHAVLEVFDLRIDLSARYVERAGQVIHLTPREYELLAYLAARKGQVVSRRSLREYVFGTTDPDSSNVVEVYVRTLRRKVDRDHDLKLIQTRRGYGYFLKSPGID